MSLAAIRELVETLDLSPTPEALIEAFAIQDLLGARIIVGVGAFEAAGGPEIDGSVSTQGWLRTRAGRDQKTAGRVAYAGRKLRSLPVLREAVLDGRLSGGQLDVIVLNVPMRHLDLFAEHESGLVPRLEDLTVDQTRTAMEHWRRRADALNPGKPPAEHDNEVYLSKTLDARGELRGSLDADHTALVDAALRVADCHDRSLTAPERRAAALAQVCQSFLDFQHGHRGGRHRPHLNVGMTYQDFCDEEFGTATHVDTGQPVSLIELAKLRCDAAWHRLLFDGPSGILDYGRATRDWPVDIYNAIVLRDGGCRFGDCSAPTYYCDVHHDPHWEHDGITSVATGILGCRRHHRLAHTPGYSTKLLPDGTFEFTHPDGRVETSHPRGLNPLQLWPHERQQPDGS